MARDYPMICERTGMRFMRSEMRQEWTGRWVHKDVWEPKHAQLTPNIPRDDQRVDVCRPNVKQTMDEVTILDFYDW